ncbi:MAG TPA: OmpA family protein [Arachidicoccus sp.]|nr:OmpA family protein [Arachidicoccus sp.]
MAKYIKTVFMLLFILGVSMIGNSQILGKLGKKIERKVNRRIEQKVDRKIDKSLDKAEKGIDGSAMKSKPIDAKMGEITQDEGNEAYVSSKFDFIPGDKIVFHDDFSEEAKGDFPVRWNTNGSGEVVTIRNLAGNWLKIPDNSISFPEFNQVLPEHFTIEFDLFYPSGVSRPPVTFGFSEVSNPAKQSIQHKKLLYFHIPASIKDNIGYSTSLYSGRETTQSWPANVMAGKPIHVSIAVSNERIRLYMGARKIFDLPKAFEPSNLRNNFHFRAAPLIPKPKEGFYVSNLRIAEAGLDARSQLLQNGRYSTTGIYFESGSAVIRKESYGVIRSIAEVMKQDPDLRIQIIGHTDNDGSDAMNQGLSKKRANAVKMLMIADFEINDQRLTAGGKGATQPVQSNRTAEGRSQNRRVEFIKVSN